MSHPLKTDELGSGVTGSRGEICRVLLRCLRERFPECEVVFETAAELVDGSTQVRIGASLRHFDLVCGADGAGSRTREELGIRFESGQFSNCSTMIRMDQNLDELDPTFLHFFSFPPVMLVAGAVNGPQNPLWFCQIGTDGPIPEMSSEWLRCNCPALLKWVSEKEMTAWSKYASSVPSGRWKILDSFVKGNVALIGDAACPFIPVGQVR